MTDDLDPKFLGSFENEDQVPKKAQDGDSIVVFRARYDAHEAWIYDSFNKCWSYAGKGTKEEMIARAEEIVAF